MSRVHTTQTLARQRKNNSGALRAQRPACAAAFCGARRVRHRRVCGVLWALCARGAAPAGAPRAARGPACGLGSTDGP
jgi:hypothetical protein